MAFGSTACYSATASRAMSLTLPRSRRLVGADAQRRTRSTVKLWSVRYWPTSEVSRGCARWFELRRHKRRTAANLP